MLKNDFASTSWDLRKIKVQSASHQVTKEYVCRVVGTFPEWAQTSCCFHIVVHQGGGSLQRTNRSAQLQDWSLQGRQVCSAFFLFVPLTDFYEIWNMWIKGRERVLDRVWATELQWKEQRCALPTPHWEDASDQSSFAVYRWSWFCRF